MDSSLSFTAALGTMAPQFINSRKDVPMSLYLHEKEMGFNFFVDSPNKEETELLRFYDPIRLGTLSMITQLIDLQVLRLFYENIASVSRMVLGSFYSNGKYLFVDFRFPNTCLDEVNKIMKSLGSFSFDVSVTRLGPSKGLINTLNEIESRIPLTVVDFSYIDNNQEEYISEWRTVFDPLGAVSYGKDGKGDIERIDLSKSPLAPLLSLLLKDKLQPAGFFENHTGGRVQSKLIIPTIFAKAFFIRYFSATEKVTGIDLQRIVPYGTTKKAGDETTQINALPPRS
ncbi:MAG: hypothetical protein LVQ63_02825 [Thermoplasmatales archaeon]|nr:hypothetical protein [Thermoplasmatales archaeon]